MKKKKHRKDGYLILGINGWVERRHDASAALVEVTKHSCKILGALEEEKIIGIKRACDIFPTKSIQYLLDMFNLSPEDIDEIAIGWNFPELYEKSNSIYPFFSDKKILEMIFGKSINKKMQIHFVNHHLAHAACSYRTSNYKDALIFVLDGQGENSSISVWKTENYNLIKLEEMPISSSLGYMYEATNYILGFQTYESGKTMGLAAYGNPAYVDRILSGFPDFKLGHRLELYMKIFSHYSIHTLDMSPTMISTWRHFFERDLGVLRNTEKITTFYKVPSIYKDLAFSVQKILEMKVIAIIKKYVAETNIHKICLGGGVALNCKMNGEVLKEKCVDSVFVNPAANDAGVSLGAALELAHQIGYCANTSGEFNPFLGIAFTNDEIIMKLKEKGIRYHTVDDAAGYVADCIEENKKLALFQGRNEWGPRALGNRSIIANSMVYSNLDYINGFVKNREYGRPLSPSIIDDECELFTTSIKMKGRYMNIAYYAENHIDRHPAIIHVDNTYRPGFVSEDFNKVYYYQLASVKKAIGSSVVINTSFNLQTPIICWIEDALEMWKTRELFSLVFNNAIIVEK